jgi:hydroxymethylpyrimidine/phosphomethylpyrimidine kinase
MTSRTHIPIALTIAGTDPSGGAGIQADLKTFSALGVYGASVIVALTAQNTVGVQGVHAVPPDFVRAQMESVFSDLPARAVKIGMVANADAVEAIVDGLREYRQRQVVLDPVMVAASGDRLLRHDAIDALRRRLIPCARLITPNLPEAAALLGQPIARDEKEMAAQGHALLSLGAPAVLVKGGHAGGLESVDLLVTPHAVERFASPRIDTQNTHGTGCTLSAAIAAGLAQGLELRQAVAEAKEYVTAAIAASSRLRVGQGHGPTHHFHAWW